MPKRKPKPMPQSKPEPKPEPKEQPVDRAARLTANATVWMAIFTLFLALTSVGTLFILWNQLGEMHSGGGDTHTLAEATHDMALQGKQNFIDEQRPYMFIDPYLTDKAGKAILKGRPVFYVGQKVHWKVGYLNYGKTPAIGFLNYGEVDFGPNAMGKALSFMAHTRLPPAKPDQPGTITPPTTTPAGFTDMYSDDEVTDADLAFMNTHDQVTVVIGRLYYNDVHGNPFYTNYCKTTFLSGAIADCPEFNSIH